MSPIQSPFLIPIRIVVLSIALLPSLLSAEEVAIPSLERRVTDLTQTLTPDERDALETKLAQFEQEKGSQVAVLLLPTTGEETIEQYGIRLADAWKVGRKKVDDGVILIVAKEDRKMRLEVGYGLEGAIPDVTAHRIIDEIITPYFKDGEFYGGINAGINAIIQRINGEPLPEPEWDKGDPTVEESPPLFITMVLIGLGLIIITGFLKGISVSFLLSLISGLIFLPNSFFLGAFSFAISILIALSVLSAIFLVGSLGGRSGGGSGWSSGGGSGGFSGGGGFGGFSGGGGGFGGGGASGSW